MLKIEGFNFGYGQNLLFDGADLHIQAGEHVAIVGDSGGGKSTLLKLVAEHEKHASISLEKGAASTMVMQEGALLDHLNVQANLELVARYAKRERSLIPKLLEQLNIDKSLHQARVSQLSGGQMRRVAIARALLSNPQLVLFDEPDAGLDIANLSSLANTVNTLTENHPGGSQAQRACMTVSHNPFYIAQIANKVYRLQGGKLVLIADWPKLPTSPEQRQERQLKLQADLAKVIDSPKDRTNSKMPTEFVIRKWFVGSLTTLGSLLHKPRSFRDELTIAGYGIYLSFVTGIIFYALVGLMLGSTTIAVVKMLADSALTGLVSMLIKPETLINMMGGRYVLYLAPAIGSMLFAARSGSIMCNWLGEMVRGKQVKALELLDVPPAQYLRAPSAIALFCSMFATITWFAVCVWAGGVLATQQLFNIENPSAVMSISQYDVSLSLFWIKNLIYSVLVAITVVALGLAPKDSAHQVNIHTTKTIIYATLSIAFAELLVILT